MESSKQLWVIGLVFTSIAIIQYFEIPYGSFLSNLIFAGQGDPVSPSGNQDYRGVGVVDGKGKNFTNNSGLGKQEVSRNAMNLDHVWDSRNQSLWLIENQKNESMSDVASRNSSLEKEKERQSEQNSSLVGDKVAVSPSGNQVPRDPSLITREGGNVTNGNSRNQSMGLFENQNDKSVAQAVIRNGSLEKEQVREFEQNSSLVGKKVTESEHNLTTGHNVTDLNIVHADTPGKSLASSIAKGSGRRNDTATSRHQENDTTRMQPSGSCFGRFNSSTESNNPSKKAAKRTDIGVVTLNMMNNILLQSQSSSSSNTMTSCSSAREGQLLFARSEIEKAEDFEENSDLYAPLYWNISRFKRSYQLMEQMLKIYVYKEGRKPVFHHPNLKGIYASEGWFMKLLEANKHYVTTNPEEAHLFYLPFSSQMLEETVYVPNSHSFDKLKEYLKNYLNTIKTRYSFWNRTSGADHFLVACHDWAPEETRTLMANCIKALCNADMKEGFQLGKDVSLPETLMQSAQTSTKELGGQRPSERHILAFFAGNMHGYVRPILLNHWQNKDPDMKIFGRLRKSSYAYHMKSSKYCLCPRGYEVNSPRVVEAIMHECVPVIISDNFVPPFLEVLNWEKFSVFVLEKDIPNLKNILVSISERRYLVMHHRVKMVRQHFLWHSSPVKYDLFHMILHSIWYNRIFRHYD